MVYDKSYHQKVHSYLCNDKDYYLAKAKISYKRYFSKIKNIKHLKVLEFGAGLGQNIFLLNKKVGYDISKFALDFCRKNNIPIIEELDEIPDNHFDIILSCHCLEHLEEPLENLKLLRKKLKVGGKLILAIPRLPHRKASFTPDKNDELFSWNFRTINNLLCRAGFKVMQNNYNYGTMSHKLLFLNKISFGLYFFFFKLVGYLLDSKEIQVIAVNPGIS